MKLISRSWELARPCAFSLCTHQAHVVIRDEKFLTELKLCEQHFYALEEMYDGTN